MMERISEVYNCENDVENVNTIYSNNIFQNNNDRIESIENSIKASLLNSTQIKKDLNTCDITLRVLIGFTLCGIIVLLGVVIYLIAHKN
jgi:hypothetical protein